MKNFLSKLDFDKVLKLFSIIISVAALLKVLLVFKDGFIADELFTAVATDPSLSFFTIAKKYLLIDTFPPFYYLMIYAWNMLFPHVTEISMRLPSYIFAWAAVGTGFFFFPKHLPKNSKYIFTAMLACSNYTFSFAYEARQYIFVLFMSVALMCLLFNMLRRFEDKKDITKGQFVLYFVITLLLSYTHYWGSLLGGAVFLVLSFYSMKYKKYRLNFILLYGAVILLLLPWMIPNLYLNIKQERFAGNWWSQIMTVKRFMFGLKHYMFATDGAKNAVVAILLIAGYFVFKGNFRLMKYQTELIVVMFVSAVVFAVTGLVTLKLNLFVPRYFIVLAPFVYLYIALSAACIIERTKWAYIPVFYMLLSMFLFINLDKLRISEREPMEMLIALQQKEIKAGILEFFPPNAVEKMYTFYPNRYYGKNMPFVDLYTHPATPIYDEDIIWMPMCEDSKIIFLENRIKQNLVISSKVKTACLLKKDLTKKEFTPSDILFQEISLYRNSKKEHKPLGALSWDVD